MIACKVNNEKTMQKASQEVNRTELKNSHKQVTKSYII